MSDLYLPPGLAPTTDPKTTDEALKAISERIAALPQRDRIRVQEAVGAIKGVLDIGGINALYALLLVNASLAARVNPTVTA